MKKILFYVTALALIGFQSCKEAEQDVDPNDNNSVELVGTWNFEGMDITDASIVIDGTEFATFDAISSNPVGTYEFKDDGSAVSNVGYTNTITSTVFGQTTTQTETVVQEPFTGTYVHDDAAKTVTITQDGETLVYNITEHTATSLILSSEFTETVDDQGVLTVTTADMTITLSK